MTLYNPILNIINVNVYIKFGYVLSIGSKDIERKWNGNGITKSQKDWPNPITPTFSMGGYTNIAPTFSKQAINTGFGLTLV